MIIEVYKAESNLTEEEKKINKEYTIYRETTGNLTDKELNDKYNKYYLLEDD